MSLNDELPAKIISLIKYSRGNKNSFYKIVSLESERNVIKIIPKNIFYRIYMPRIKLVFNPQSGIMKIYSSSFFQKDNFTIFKSISNNDIFNKLLELLNSAYEQNKKTREKIENHIQVALDFSKNGMI